MRPQEAEVEASGAGADQGDNEEGQHQGTVSGHLHRRCAPPQARC